AHCAEKGGIDRAKAGDVEIIFIDLVGAAFDYENSKRIVVADRQLIGQADRLHARQRREFGQELVKEDGAFGGVWVTLVGKRQHHRQQIAWVETWIGGAHGAHASERQTRADQQNHSQRDFADDQQVPYVMTARAATGAVARVFERLVQIGIRRVRRGRQAEEQSSEERKQQGKCEHCIINTQFLDAIIVEVRVQRHDQVFAPRRQKQAERAAQQRQRKTLGQ